MEEVKKEEVKEEKVHRLDKKNPEFEVFREHYAVIIVKKEDKSYRFDMPFGAPLSECYMAAVEVLKEIKVTYEAAIKKMKEDEAEKKKSEEKTEGEASKKE